MPMPVIIRIVIRIDDNCIEKIAGPTTYEQLLFAAHVYGEHCNYT